jgi:hypothetical protein
MRIAAVRYGSTAAVLKTLASAATLVFSCPNSFLRPASPALPDNLKKCGNRPIND